MYQTWNVERVVEYMSKEKAAGKIAEAAKEIIKPIYDDARPLVKPTMGLLSLPVRAVKASLINLEKWVVVREQNLEDFISKQVPEKLQGIPDDNIKTPNPNVAIPILQAASYCDSDELRNMYAEILAKSMYDKMKGDVHPSFVKVIEQLCPDEAKILNYLNDSKKSGGNNRSAMFIAEMIVDKKPYQLEFSDLGINAGCEEVLNTPMYISNLTRLGLIETYDVSKKIEYNLEHPELKKNIEVKFTLLIAQLISDDAICWDEAGKVMGGGEGNLKYKCYYSELFKTTEYFSSLAYVAISPIKK